MDSWQNNLIESDDAVLELLRASRRIAVLGIKPESHAGRPAHDVPRFLQDHGYEIVPVPVHYPDIERILGVPVYRTVSEIPGDVDIVDVFRKPADIPAHISDIVAKRPGAVWFQLGIRNDSAARELAEAGIKVVQDRCLKIEQRKLGRR
jgi:predicted CoA-binding protein